MNQTATKPASRTDPRTVIANCCVDVFDVPLLRALSEPARIEILRELVKKGPADIKAIAEDLPQDRSVISRHLKVLEETNIICSRKDGRHVRYEIDGPTFADQFEAMGKFVRDLAPVCCPGDDQSCC